MDQFSSVARELGGIEKIINTLLNLDATIKDALWNRSARVILGRLRDLYFRQNGTLGFLRRVASGQPVPDEILQEVRSSFYGREAAVTEAIADLRRMCDFGNIRLSVEEAELFEQIVRDKTSIRNRIRDIFHALEHGDICDPQRNQAQELCDSIEGLNAMFHDAEAQLRNRI